MKKRKPTSSKEAQKKDEKTDALKYEVAQEMGLPSKDDIKPEKNS